MLLCELFREGRHDDGVMYRLLLRGMMTREVSGLLLCLGAEDRLGECRRA